MPAAALSYFMNQIITNGMYRVTIDQKPDQGRRLAIDRHIDATLADALMWQTRHSAALRLRNRVAELRDMDGASEGEIRYCSRR